MRLRSTLLVSHNETQFDEPELTCHEALHPIMLSIKFAINLSMDRALFKTSNLKLL
jgi:hypothetical protein